jgi:hypothetical protein
MFKKMELMRVLSRVTLKRYRTGVVASPWLYGQ